MSVPVTVWQWAPNVTLLVHLVFIFVAHLHLYACLIWPGHTHSQLVTVGWFRHMSRNHWHLLPVSFVSRISSFLSSSFSCSLPPPSGRWRSDLSSILLSNIQLYFLNLSSRWNMERKWRHLSLTSFMSTSNWSHVSR